MSNQLFSPGDMDVSDISEFSEEDLLHSQLPCFFPNIDLTKCYLDNEKENKKTRKQLQRATPYNHQMRSELSRLKTFISWGPVSAWSPQEMAGAGFYNACLKDSIQCFCCGLVFCRQQIQITPLSNHKRIHPACEFIQGKEVGNIPKYDVRVQFPEENAAESAEMSKDEQRLESFKNWPFYARTDPTKLATAGFFFTGRKDTVQCFACKGSLGNWEEGDDPWKEHAKWFPECEFLNSKKSQNEIAQYIQDYHGFTGVTGKSFTRRLNERILPRETDYPIYNIYEDEAVRLDSFKTWTQQTDIDAFAYAKLGYFYTGSTLSSIYQDERIRLNSFKNWPQEAHADAATLAKGGFFYTGRADAVTCFCCGLELWHFEKGDNPWMKHKKCCPSCEYLLGRMMEEDDKVPLGSQSIVMPTQENESKILTERNEDTGASVTGMAPDEGCWLEAVHSLNVLLTRAYRDTHFSKISSFGDSTHVTVDLGSLFGDLAIVSKDTSNHKIKQLTFPEVLSDLDSIIIIEGEAGSGKTALLRKIAVLWASGCCPMLNRFSLVFYLSLSSTHHEQGIADMICKQLLEPTGSLTEASLKEIIQKLKNQVLFLVDDYGEIDSVPEVIEELIHKNHINRLCLVLAVRTNRSGRVRRFANTVLSLMEFPLYSTLYMLKNLFSHNLIQINNFAIKLLTSNSMQTAFKTPLVTVAQCAFWVQYPRNELFSVSNIFEAYLLYITFKFPKEREKVKSMISSCGELALKCLFKSCFDFTDEDLREVGVNVDDALRFGLLSTFTAQRLHPVHRFFHPSFQEFLAGQRLSELLESEVQEDMEKGVHYLQQIDTFFKVVGRYYFLLKYSTRGSAKATSKILSHLFSLVDCKAALESQVGNKAYLQHHPELELLEQTLSTLLFINGDQEAFRTYLIHLVLDFALDTPEEGNNDGSCTPIILQLLTGKTLSFNQSSWSNHGSSILRFIGKHPESLSVLNSMQVILTGQHELPTFPFSALTDSLSSMAPMTIEPEYSMGFQLIKDMEQKAKQTSEDKHNLESFFPKKVGLEDHFVRPFSSAQSYKVPLLKIQADQLKAFSENDCRNLTALLTAAQHTELQMHGNSGFVESIKPAIEKCRDSFIKCHIQNAELNTEEQKAILLMTAVESLVICSQQDAHIPEHIFRELDKFTSLKELTLKLHGNCTVFAQIPKSFDKLGKIEKLSINSDDFGKNSSRLVEFLQNCKNLRVFHLTCNWFSNFEALMNVLSPCNNLQEIRLQSFFQHKEIVSLASAMPCFPSLKVLDLNELHVMIEGISEDFARALGSLVHLEELGLPLGIGIRQVAKLIIQQLRKLPSLRILQFCKSLTDESVLELAQTAKEGYLKNLEKLCFRICDEITESGWRNFFQTLDNLPHLRDLDFGKTYDHLTNAHSTIVKSFVQCISRLPSITTIDMHGWLFDAEDLAMFNSMKEQHPQSKSLTLVWQWTVPFSPILKE